MLGKCSLNGQGPLRENNMLIVSCHKEGHDFSKEVCVASGGRDAIGSP